MSLCGRSASDRMERCFPRGAEEPPAPPCHRSSCSNRPEIRGAGATHCCCGPPSAEPPSLEAVPPVQKAHDHLSASNRQHAGHQCGSGTASEAEGALPSLADQYGGESTSRSAQNCPGHSARVFGHEPCRLSIPETSWPGSAGPDFAPQTLQSGHTRRFRPAHPRDRPPLVTDRTPRLRFRPPALAATRSCQGS